MSGPVPPNGLCIPVEGAPLAADDDAPGGDPGEGMPPDDMPGERGPDAPEEGGGAGGGDVPGAPPPPGPPELNPLCPYETLWGIEGSGICW